MANYLTTMSQPAVQIADLRVVRGGRSVIPGLSAAIPAGVVTGLLGPSGCGKTTLMRSIIGVQKITKGTVTVLGESAGSPTLRRRVAYVTQTPSVYGDLTVRENLRFFAAVLRTDAVSVETAMETVNLVDSADSRVDRLSGGERSRVSLAVALLGEPEVLILDEPTVGLDPVLRKQLWGTFAALAAEGKAIVVSSHVMDEASRCDRLLLMREGRLIADDTPEGLLAATGTSDIESAFLALVQAEEVAA
jgi:ABC-2 type transport system ATP-binding protein